jgi:hypothetical protein
VIADGYFDNAASHEVIGGITIEEMPQEQIDKLFPDAFEKLNDGKNTIQLEYPIDVMSSVNPDAVISLTKTFSGVNWEQTQNFEDKGYYNTFQFSEVPGGTMMLSPVDGYVTTAIAEIPPKSNDKADINALIIDFEAENGNHYHLVITGGTPEIVYAFKNILGAPLYEPQDATTKPLGAYGIFVKKGEPISQIVCAETVNVGLIVNEGKYSESLYLPTNIEFFSTPEGKLISPSNNP